MPTMDQVAWANANILVGDSRPPYPRGALLPEPATAEEAADRSLLRMIGAVRTVEVVYTAEELAEQARARGTADAAAAHAGEVDTTLPMGDQVTTPTPAGPPTLHGGTGAPVVIGDEDLKREHEAARKAAAEPKGEDKGEDKGEAEHKTPQHQARRSGGNR